MNKARAIREIESVLASLRTLSGQDRRHLHSRNQGKLYELYILARLLRHLRRRGFRLRHVGNDIRFKQAPGKLYVSDPHFVLESRGGAKLWLFVDIEFQTLGHRMRARQGDLSALHELDLVVLRDVVDGSNPAYDQVLLAVECKSNAVFEKSIVREALGLRRELSLLAHPVVSDLSHIAGTRNVCVAAEPASEFWLAFIDSRGRRYKQSPAAFGIALRHMKP